MKYEPSLDGLRAVAVTAVMVSHIWNKQAPGGSIGVDVFFVLSGFLITTILQQEALATGRIDYRRFYLNRVYRLAPALAAMVTITVAMSYLTGTNLSQVWAQAGFALSYLMNWARALTGQEFGPMGHTWSLSVEEQFYLFWPVVLFSCPNRHRLRMTILLIFSLIAWRTALVANGASVARVYNGFDTRASGLLIGCALGLWSLGRPPARVPAVFGLFSFVTLFVAFRYGFDGHAFSRYWDNLAASLISAAVLLAARGERIFQRMLSARPMVFTGRISYGLYLWHAPIMFFTIPYAFRRDVPALESHILQIGVFALSYGVAVTSWYLVELPFLRLKRHPKFARVEVPSKIDQATLTSSGSTLQVVGDL